MSDFIVSGPESDPLSPFSSLGKKTPWSKRLELIKKQFPSVDRLKWVTVFSEDPEVMGKIIADILKISAANTGRPGKRPALDPEEARRQYKQLIGEDFTEAPFQVAFTALVGDRSIRGVAAKTGLDRNMVHRLLHGNTEPTVEIMEKVAAAFKKEPGYFVEYRNLYILGVLNNRLETNPEATIKIYRRMRNAEGNPYGGY